MPNSKLEKQKQLDKAVKSKLKDMGLDALFHTVDNADNKTKKASNSRSSLPTLKKNALKNFCSIFKSQSNEVVSVFIDSGYINIVALKIEEQLFQITKAEHIRIPDNLTKASAFITEQLTEHLLPFNEHYIPICSIIPRQKVITKILHFPTDNHDEIKKMIDFEAEHNISLPLNECIVDYSILSAANGQSEILLAAVKRGEIAEHLKPYHTAGIQLSSINMSALALYGLMSQQELSQGKIIQIYVGYNNTDINIVDGGYLKTSRGIPWGYDILLQTLSTKHNVSLEFAAKIATENGIIFKKTLKNDVSKLVTETITDWANKLIEEINETIRSYEFQDSPSSVDKIIITGQGTNVTNLDEYLREELKIKTVILDSHIDNNETFKTSLNELNLLTGIADRFKKSKEINLLPSAERQTHSNTLQRMKFSSLLFVCGIFLFILWALPLGVISLRNVQLSNIEKNIAAIKPQAIVVKDLRDRIGTIKDYRSITYSCIEVLREISRLVSQDVKIDTFFFNQRNFVKLIGEADSHTSVVHFSRALRESSLFKDAILSYTRKTERLKDNVKFEIICNLNH